MQSDAHIIEQAIGWQLRLASLDADGWVSFTAWLEASPAHAAAFDRIAAQDRLIGDAHFPQVAEPAENDNRPRRWLWAIAGTGIAAAIAILIAPMAMAPRTQPYEVATRNGERQTVRLADGTSIEMSGGTRLRLDHADARVAELESGEATFHVRHDAANPFTLTSGRLAIRDLGTVFDVTRGGMRLQVAVSEGSVMFQPGGEKLMLAAGDAIDVREDLGVVTRSRVAPDLVGGWRNGALSFDGQTLGEVATSLNRLYAAGIVLDGDLSHRPFTGMVRFTGAADRDVPHLAALIGTNWRRDGAGWILSDGAGTSR